MENIGKKFERDLFDALSQMQKDYGIYFHRFRDSLAAGRLLGPAPADFLVAGPGSVQLWEAKASDMYPSLANCLSRAVADKGQLASHRIWHLNGHQTYFIFYSGQTDHVEVWDGEEVVHARLNGKASPLYTPDLECHISDLSDLRFLFDMKGKPHDDSILYRPSPGGHPGR